MNAFINQSDVHNNWLEVLDLWNRIANWVYYQTTESELRQQLKSMLIYLWNEKDWLQQEYPVKSKQIEQAINASLYMCIVGDLANMLKHRNLTKRRRSAATLTNYYGQITVSKSAERRMYYIRTMDGKHEEIMSILRKALDEFEELRFTLFSAPL